MSAFNSPIGAQPSPANRELGHPGNEGCVRATAGRDPMNPRGDGVSGLMEKLKLSGNEMKSIKIGGAKAATWGGWIHRRWQKSWLKNQLEQTPWNCLLGGCGVLLEEWSARIWGPRELVSLHVFARTGKDEGVGRWPMDVWQGFGCGG